MERPILMSAPMVRAILAGEKTQTRRVCKPAEKAGLSFVVPLDPPGWFGNEEGGVEFKSPYGARCDRLWVREAWRTWGGTVRHVDYRATTDVPRPADGWKPSIHMRRADSRILLEVTGVRVELLQDISGRDCVAEGIAEVTFRPGDGYPLSLGYMIGPDDGSTKLKVTPQEPYRELWEQINGAGSWDLNPWVWVVEFKRVA